MTWRNQFYEEAEALFLELLEVEPVESESGICLHCKQGIQGHAETCPWLRGRILRDFGKVIQ